LTQFIGQFVFPTKDCVQGSVRHNRHEIRLGIVFAKGMKLQDFSEALLAGIVTRMAKRLKAPVLKPGSQCRFALGFIGGVTS
jgi:hypothetical protein